MQICRAHASRICLSAPKVVEAVVLSDPAIHLSTSLFFFALVRVPAVLCGCRVHTVPYTECCLAMIRTTVGAAQHVPVRHLSIDQAQNLWRQSGTYSVLYGIWYIRGTYGMWHFFVSAKQKMHVRGDDRYNIVCRRTAPLPSSVCG